jgi:hypothetical protein
MSYKRKLKARTVQLLTDLMKTLVTPDQAKDITREAVLTQLGRRTYYKNQETGTVHLGLCYKQVRKEVKKNPNVTVEDIKRINKLG